MTNSSRSFHHIDCRNFGRWEVGVKIDWEVGGWVKIFWEVGGWGLKWEVGGRVHNLKNPVGMSV